jgi:hypothetical protein
MVKTILILASNPKGTQPLNLNKEIDLITEGLRRSQNCNEFCIISRSDVSPKTLRSAMSELKPQIVHFCGHGKGQQGLVLQDDNGRERLVRTEELTDLFKIFAEWVECVVLNACYSEEQANAIVQHVNYVIGMNQAVRDDAAIVFAEDFYQGIGDGLSIEKAFELGRNAVLMEIESRFSTDDRKLNLPLGNVPKQPLLNHLIPILKKKDGFCYDAYISYVEQEPDASWVWNTLIPRLEQAKLRIAISGDRERPGVARVKNMEDGIAQSKRTILVLSEAYLADNWADFENVAAQTMGIEEGRYRLLPIKFAPMDRTCLPVRLSMLSTLDLGHPHRRDREFNRLVQALQGSLPQR